MQYFNTSNSEVDFIKDKLRSEYVPTVRMFNSEVNIQPEFKTSSSSDEIDSENVISNENNYQFFDGENIIYNDTIQVCKENNSEKVNHKYVKRYDFGKFYPNITTNFISNKNYYSSELHEYLGRYLRAYRDYYKIDVMNFYNCFSNRFISSYTLPILLYEMPYSLTTKAPNSPAISDNEKVKLGLGGNKNNLQYKLVAFPILFDTKYTVKFYTPSITEVQYQAVWFNGESPLGAVEVNQNKEGFDVTESNTWEPKIYTEQMSSTFTICIGSKDAVDIQYSESETEDGSYNQGDLVLNFNEEKALSKQRNLYIFMMFPSDISAPIVVIEQPKFTYALNNELLELPQTEKEQVAFSDVLLEYLTGAVITSADTIHKNVHRIQQKIMQNNFFNKYGVGGPNYANNVDIPNYKFANGIFDEGMHQLIYKAFFDAGVAKIKDGEIEDEEGNKRPILKPVLDGTEGAFYPKGYDKIPNFIGYVDKNVEDLIMAVPDDSSTQEGGK